MGYNHWKNTYIHLTLNLPFYALFFKANPISTSCFHV